MEFTQAPAEYKADNKRNIIIGIAVWTAVSVVADWIAVESETAYRLSTILSGIGYVVGLILWVHADARKRNIPLSAGFRIAAIIFGFFALIYYLFRSRGFSGGFISIGWLLLYIVALLVLSIIVNIVLALISDRLGLFA
jgi:hypothetical protein